MQTFALCVLIVGFIWFVYAGIRAENELRKQVDSLNGDRISDYSRVLQLFRSLSGLDATFRDHVAEISGRYSEVSDAVKDAHSKLSEIEDLLKSSLKPFSVESEVTLQERYDLLKSLVIVCRRTHVLDTAFNSMGASDQLQQMVNELDGNEVYRLEAFWSSLSPDRRYEIIKAL